MSVRPAAGGAGGEVDAGADDGGGEESGDEIHGEFGGGVVDEDGVGVDAGELFVGDFEFVVDFLGIAERSSGFFGRVGGGPKVVV